MTRYLRQALLFFLCSLSATPLFSQAQPYIIQKRLIAQQHGLPDRNVNCGIQDKFGFLWFGTRSGLCYYDGTQFTFLSREHGLRGSSVLSLAADDSSGIIISYIEPGSSGNTDTLTDVVDINTREVKPLAKYYPSLPFREEDLASVVYVKGKPLRFLMKDDRRSSWTYASRQGFRKEPLRGRPFKVKVPGIEKLTPAAVADIQSNLLESLILNERDSTVITRNANNNVLFCPGKGFIVPFSGLLNEDESLFLLKFDGTLLPIDSAGKMEAEVGKYRGNLWSPNYDHYNRIVSAHNDQDVAIMEIPSREIIFYSPATGVHKLFEEKENIKVRSFFKDRLGAWWLCTNVGIWKVTAQKNVFTNHFTRDNPKFSFNNSARGIYVDDDVLSVSLYDSPVIIYKGDTIMPGTIENFAAVRVNDALWFGQYFTLKFDLRSRKFSHMAPSLLSEIWSIFSLSETNFLLGCSKALARYNVTTGDVVPITHKEYPSPKFVYRIFRTSQGQLMAVAENGIYLLAASGDIVNYYSIYAKDPDRKLSFNGVQDVYEDREGIFWIASSQDGLFRWNKKEHRFQQFGIGHGFLSTTIFGVQEDEHNNLWLSTDYGLTRFNKTSQKAITYTVDDGLASNEFNRASSFKDKHGQIYFGGMNGVTSFHPDDLHEKESEKHYDFPLKGIYCLNAQTGSLDDKTEEVKNSGSILLNEDTKSFIARFTLLDYEDRPHRYAYKLEGLDKDWTYINDANIQIGNLPYNSYQLRIRAQLANGDWYTKEISLKVIVPAPFYKQWWFNALVLLILTAAVVLTIRLRERVLKNTNTRLEKLVDNRTKELQASLNEQKAMLQEIHHRVKNNLQFIEAIIAMQINLAQEESNQTTLMDINRRINAMTLVHEMLYNRDGIETISAREYIEGLIDKLRSLIDTRKTPIAFNIYADDVYLDINNGLAIGMITTELVSNSLKHAFAQVEKPEITIELTMLTDKTLSYHFRDNGPGIPVEPGQGLGMRLIDIFARQLRGTYDLKNDHGVFFSFTFKPKETRLK